MNLPISDYLGGAEAPSLNDIGRKTFKLSEDIQDDTRAMDSAWVGVRMVNLFKQYEWIQSLSITADPYYSSNDEGGYFKTIDLVFEDLVVVEGAVIPDAFTRDGKFARNLFSDHLQEEFEVEEFTVYHAFYFEDDLEALQVTVDRRLLEGFNAEGSFSGREAFRRLFPTFADRVENTRSEELLRALGAS